MTDTAQDYQKLLSDALQKQMIILGKQVALMKARNVPGLSVSEDGRSVTISDDPQKVVTQFLAQFRELSSPLVKKTMQPLLSVALPMIPQTPSVAPSEKVENKEEHSEEHPTEEKSVPQIKTADNPERKEEGSESKSEAVH